MNTLYTRLSLLILLLLQLPAMAQQAGSLTGTVKTTNGQPAEYIGLTIKNAAHAAKTDKNGTFQIKNIKPGTYVLRLSAIGIASQEVNITIASGQESHVDLQITASSSQLEEVAINGAASVNLKQASLSKIGIAPKDLPQSVQIISSRVIQDQQVNRLSDAMRNVNGVALGANRGSVGENFYARGYSLGSNNVFKNGVRTTIGGMPEASTLESVEVLKGSSALLYGGVSGGAIVNMVTKKPKFEYGGEVSLRAGSYNLYKPTVDVYGPISDKLAFRVIGTYENSDSYRDVVKSERLYINPSLLYKLSENTEITLQGDYLKSDFTPDFGIGTVANAVSPLARNTFINTAWAYNKTNTATSQLMVNHNFSENWKINASASLQSYNRNYFSAERPFALKADGVASRNLTRSKTKEFTYNQQININGTFNTGTLRHTLLIGADADQSNTNAYGFAYANKAEATGSFNLLDPTTYGTSNISPETSIITDSFTPIYRMGAFVQDMVAITDKFKVLAGIRWTFQKTPATKVEDVNTQVVAPTTAASKIDKAFSPKVGFIFQPVQTTTLYVSYANNFIPNTGVDIYKSPLGASILDHYEAGVKNDFFDGRLSANVTWYKIVNDKFAQMAILDANGAPNADANIKEFSGETASNGLEIDINGTIAEGLHFLAGYSYNYMRYIKTLDAPASIIEGERLVGTTKNTANGSIFYTFGAGAVKGLKLGTSVFYTGDRNGGRNTNKGGTSTGIIPVKGFTTVDISAGYSWKRLSLLAKLSNITDEINYYIHENYSVNPIPPRQFLTTLSYKFK